MMATTDAREYHVAMTGDDTRAGTKLSPFRTISAAANAAQPGDVISVHEGVYREWVNPPRGGVSDDRRITYQAAPGEKVTITGSEIVKNWERVNNDTWRVIIANAFFGHFNPYAEVVHGDWFTPMNRVHHRGCVYLGGDWLMEARNLPEVLSPPGKLPLWFGQVGGDGYDAGDTTIWAQFPGIDPNRHRVEINVRPTVFTPGKINIDYITVRGFELCNAATNWAAPTAGQAGLVTAYWCKGWIIENNEIHHSRCSGIALAKYSDEWNGRRGSAEGYRLTINDALQKGGWTRQNIGSHLVRKNHIHHCGQTGIVGSLGCAFSRVVGNEIHDINRQGIWKGEEMAGIKFHGALDVVIADNHIHRYGPFAAIWLDWMAQGTQVIGNLLHGGEDVDGTPCENIFTEVNHGPFLVANNLLLSPAALVSNSQGGAYVHNLIAGTLRIRADDRRTPYHKAHGTELMGLHNCPIGDLRWYNNIFVAGGDFRIVDRATWPITASGNVYTKGSSTSKFDQDVLLKPDFDPGIKLEQRSDGWYLTITTDVMWGDEVTRHLVTTELLGHAKIPDQPFENPDGSALKIAMDYFGHKRDAENPFPGPFEITTGGTHTYKVWPK